MWHMYNNNDIDSLFLTLNIQISHHLQIAHEHETSYQ